jgi:hypothetical protein
MPLVHKLLGNKIINISKKDKKENRGCKSFTPLDSKYVISIFLQSPKNSKHEPKNKNL